MIRNLKRTICIVVACMLFCTLFSCAKKPEPLEMTDDEAKEVLEKLIPLAKEVNEIFYGKGLECEDTGEENVIFMPVAGDSSIKTEADIRVLAEKAYSKAYLSGVYTMMFDGVKAENADGVVDFAADPRYKEIGGRLYINIGFDSYDLSTEYDISTAVVSEKTPDYVSVELSYTVGGKDMGKLKLKLVDQLGEWRLDTPTY